MQRIIYPMTTGGVAIVTPTGLLPIEEVARKDVPAGVPYRIVSDEDLPADWSLQEAWSADFSAPHGHGIGAEAWFAEQAEAEDE
jgi:hypothetical protein